VDFGIAKLASSSTPRLTVVGTLVGTPTYMAPEQVFGDAQIGPATDVWGLAITLYEMTTGRVPFEGIALEVLFSNIVTAPLPYPRHLDDFDSKLFSLLASATRKRPEERPTAHELTAMLRDFLRERGAQFDLGGRSLESYCLATHSNTRGGAS
jgi:serine/threonine-protein kinase